MSDIEIRNLARVIELRKSQNGPGTLEGYAAVFNRYSQNLGGYVEQVDPAAFNKSLADKVSVVARYNHADNYLLGTTDSGTLALSADGTGLRYAVDLPDTSVGRDVSVLAARGDLRHSSFAFMTMKDDWSVTDQGFPLRTLQSVSLVDVAPVNSPAYLDTTVALRSLAARLDVNVTDIRDASTDDIRSMLLDEHRTADNIESTEEQQAQVDNHAALLRIKALELIKLKDW
jgi:HK97 family phage prohead protease